MNSQTALSQVAVCAAARVCYPLHFCLLGGSHFLSLYLFSLYSVKNVNEMQ